MPIALPLPPPGGPAFAPQAQPAVYQLTYRGLALGDGTDFELIQIEGLESLPEIAQADLKIDQDQGEFLGAYFMKGRLVTFDLEVHAATDAQFRADLDALGAAMAPSATAEAPLAYLLPGMAQLGRVCFCRPLTRVAVIDINYTHRKALAQVALYATDPRLYDYVTQFLTLALPASLGGLTWPTAWPASWGTAGSGGTVTATNAGTIESRPLLTILGPIDNPTVQNNTTGQSFTWLGSLLATDRLVIDMAHKTIQVNGSGSARGLVSPTSQWWTIIPGANVLQFSANTIRVGSSLSVAFASAWA